MKTISAETIRNDEEETDLERGKWDMGTSTNSRSFELESWSYVQHQNYHLQLLQKKDVPSDRRTIPATLLQRLTYYRCLVAAPAKTHAFYLQHEELNKFFWYYICTLFLKSLPSAYIALFLSSYVSEEHLYLAKMVPCLMGSSLGVIFAGFFDLLFCTDYLLLLLYYLFVGIFFKNPWNRCHEKITDIGNVNVTCYTLAEFAKITLNQNPGIEVNYYVAGDGEKFQMAPMIYFRKARENLKSQGFNFTACSICLVVIWTIVSFHQRTIFGKYIWRVMNIVQWMLMFIFILTTLHLAFTYFDRDTTVFSKERKVNITVSLWKMELEMLAESITAPPVIHVLTSRSTSQINPGRDSGIIMASNAIYYLFKGVLSNKLKLHCESFVNTTIMFTKFNQYPWFYVWPIYFSTFYLGNIYSIIFFTSNLLVELVTFIITYQCLVEVIVCEYPKLKRWFVVLFMYIAQIIVYHSTTIRIRFYLFAYSKSITTLVEILALSWLYPLGRLIDDITFHCSSKPSDIRILSLRTVGFYYLIKLYYLITEWRIVLDPMPYTFRADFWMILLVTAPLVLGFVYTVFLRLFLRNENWRFMVLPKPNFGPRNHITRQLRKQFDSREYVGSQASRYLSRYLMSKSEADTYKLDIRYYDKSRRSTVMRTHVDMKTE